MDGEQLSLFLSNVQFAQMGIADLVAAQVSPDNFRLPLQIQEPETTNL